MLANVYIVTDHSGDVVEVLHDRAAAIALADLTPGGAYETWPVSGAVVAPEGLHP
jgi:hypothetical protein